MAHSDISFCNTTVDAAVRYLWPDSSCRANFLPLVDLEFGDIGSDVVIALSNERKEAPEVLSEKLLGHLASQDKKANFSICHGYLNFRSDSCDVAFEESPPQATAIPIHVMFCGRVSGVPLESSFRVLCAALLQATLLLETDHRVVFWGASGRYDLSRDVLLELVRAECECLVKTSSLQLPDIHGALETLSSEPMFLWLPPSSYPRKQFGSIVHHPHRVSGQAVLKTPDATWCRGIPTLAEGYLQQVCASWTLFERAMYYFASAESGFDLDPAVVFLNESANTRWFIDFLYARVSEKFDLRLSSAQELSDMSDFHRCILTRLKYISYHRFLAAAQGNVPEYLTVYCHLLRMGNRFFNDPSLRARITASQLTDVDRQILSGVYRALQLVYRG